MVDQLGLVEKLGLVNRLGLVDRLGFGGGAAPANALAQAYVKIMKINETHVICCVCPTVLT